MSTKSMEKLFIIVPAYNEEETIERVVKEWYSIIEAHSGVNESRLVVIDDGSKDHTFTIMKNLRKKYPMMVALTKENEGHGATVLYGYHYALQNGADYIFQTDSDGQTNPEEFEEFWKLRKTYDMVIGSRKHREDGWSRIVVTKILKIVIFICFGEIVEDANTPFRLIKANTLREDIRFIPDKYNLTNVILSVVLIKRKRKVKYLPISFKQRQGGINSINLKQISKIGLQALKDFKKINRKLKRSEL